MNSKLNKEFGKETLEKWEEIHKEEEFQKMDLPKEMLPVLKAIFCSAFEKGQDYMIDSMREIFNNDPCLFEDFFEIDK